MNKEPLVASLAHVLDGKLKNLEQNAARAMVGTNAVVLFWL